MNTGSMFQNSDVDLYMINIVDAVNFSASTVNLTTIDTQLFLFDASGFGVTFNDDASALQSTITGQFVNSAGIYYLAISTYDNDATSGGLEIWLDTPYGIERQPDGPGAGGALDGWDLNFGSTGDYSIALSGVEFVPAPGALALLGVAALARRRRRH